MLRRAFVAHIVAANYIALLSPTGFDSSSLADLNTRIGTFITAIQNKALEVASRDIAQENRVDAGNALYAQLENDLCAAAKRLLNTMIT